MDRQKTPRKGNHPHTRSLPQGGTKCRENSEDQKTSVNEAKGRDTGCRRQPTGHGAPCASPWSPTVEESWSDEGHLPLAPVMTPLLTAAGHIGRVSSHESFHRR